MVAATLDLQKAMPDIGLGCANVMKAGLIELIETAARHGFTRISARPYAFAEALEEGFTEKSLRQRLKDAGVKVMLIDGLNRGLPGVPSPDTIDSALRSVYPPDVFNPPSEDICFRAAEYLEAPAVNLIHHRGSPLPQDQLAEAVGKICGRAKARGLRIALEFVPNTGFASLPIAQAISEACGEPNCGIVLDFFHLDRSGGTVDDIRRLPPNAIDNIQISDRTPLPPGAAYKPMSGRQMPGEGKLPLRDLMAAALANSPNASADIEVLNDELRELSTDAATARLAAVAKSWRATL
jgi:sugar phosphate isomerase/epimerase